MAIKHQMSAATAAVLGFCAMSSAAYAGSALFPGITAGIPLGAAPPEGLYAIQLPSYGYRDTSPGQNVAVLVPAWIIWSTPWTLAGGHVLFDVASPMANVNAHGVINRGGFVSPLIDAQIKWDLGGGFFGGFQAGVWLPVQTDLNSLGTAHDFASFQAIGALSYLKDGWDLSGTLVFGTGRSGSATSLAGTYGPDWGNIDLTATRKFGKFEAGLVGFASADLDAPNPGYAKQSQIALGGLVGYDFGPLNLQFKLTRDVMQANYGGYETRFWTNVTIPLWVAAPRPSVVAKY